ncbi:MAG: hypothetical protein ACTHLN_05130 [Tepidisphaeraceae bacterium]
MIDRTQLRFSAGCCLAGLLTVVLGGCHAKPSAEAELVAPAAVTLVREFPGTALSGPQPAAPPADADQTAWSVSARILGAEPLPGDPFQLIGPAAHLVVSAQPGTLLAPTAKLIYSTRYLSLKPADTLEKSLPSDIRQVNLRTLNGAMLLGTTTSFEISLPDDAPRDDKLSRRRVAIQLYRESNDPAYELALVSTDLSSAQKETSPAEQEKIVVHRTLESGADHLIISIPMAFPRSAVAGLLVDLQVSTDRPDAATLEAARTDLKASAQEAAGRLTRPDIQPAELAISTLLDRVVAAGGSQSLRPLLSFLAQQADAKLSESVILVADPSVLELIQGEIRQRVPKLASRDKPTVSWMLDRATIAAVGSIKEEQAPALLPPIIGALSIYAGEAGRQLDLLQSLAKQSVNSDDLYARIIAEQQIALEDNSPAVRVRAYDWLNERGAGPANYNPLGPARERRAAIEQFHDILATHASFGKLRLIPHHG